MRKILFLLLLITSNFTFSQKLALDSLIKQIDFNHKTGKLRGNLDLFDKIATNIITSGYKKIILEVHTDSRGKSENNILLSEKVAKKIKVILVGLGVKQQIKTIGFGESKPLSCVSTRVSHGINRRVEIKVE